MGFFSRMKSDAASLEKAAKLLREAKAAQKLSAVVGGKGSADRRRAAVKQQEAAKRAIAAARKRLTGMSDSGIRAAALSADPTAGMTDEQRARYIAAHNELNIARKVVTAERRNSTMRRMEILQPKCPPDSELFFKPFQVLITNFPTRQHHGTPLCGESLEFAERLGMGTLTLLVNSKWTVHRTVAQTKTIFADMVKRGVGVRALRKRVSRVADDGTVLEWLDPLAEIERSLTPKTKRKNTGPICIGGYVPGHGVNLLNKSPYAMTLGADFHGAHG